MLCMSISTERRQYFYKSIRRNETTIAALNNESFYSASAEIEAIRASATAIAALRASVKN